MLKYFSEVIKYDINRGIILYVSSDIIESDVYIYVNNNVPTY